MDIDLDAQLDKSRQSEIIRLYRELGYSYRGGAGSDWYWTNPVRMLRRNRIAHRLDSLIKQCIKHKFSEPPAKSRSVLALSLHETQRLTAEILDQTCDQLKSFLFAGHDTTSILLQWIFYELSRTPRVLRAVRAELDELFGPDATPAVVRSRLLSPHGDDLVRRMSYTSAVIKEALRMYPPAGSARMAKPGSSFTVHLPDGGDDVCLDGVVVYNCQGIIQRDPAVYGDSSDDFVPERWLGDSDTSMQTNSDAAVAADLNTDSAGVAAAAATTKKVPASAWRPFERGPRNCIGQELANIEARVILACAVRRYDFSKVGLGAIKRDDLGRATLNSKGQYQVQSEVYNVSPLTPKRQFARSSRY